MKDPTDPNTTSAEALGLDVTEDALWRVTLEAGKKMAATIDRLVGEEVTHRLGHNSWQVFAIAHRLRRVRFKDSPSELWYLDDKPLIEIWPLETQTVQEGDATKLNLAVKYRTFRT